jgi:tetratricopeptide (TPR) repeat protein
MANYIHAMALFYARDKAQFRAMADLALMLAPGRPDNLAVIGTHLMLTGEWEQGLGLVTQAMAMNPYHPNWHYLALSLYNLHYRRFSEALHAVERFAALDFFPFQINLAVIHGYLGNEHEAQSHLERMFDLWPDVRQNKRHSGVLVSVRGSCRSFSERSDESGVFHRNLVGFWPNGADVAVEDLFVVIVEVLDYLVAWLNRLSHIQLIFGSLLPFKRGRVVHKPRKNSWKA